MTYLTSVVDRGEDLLPLETDLNEGAGESGASKEEYTTELEIAVIRRDGGTQSRSLMDGLAIEEYATSMLNGDEFPAIIVFYDGSEYWLADGFHRVEAATKAELATIKADIRQGTQRDAVLFSCGANARHGLRRTNGDKRRAVTVLLQDEEWKQWSNRAIAKQVGVHHSMVGTIREELGQIQGDRLFQRGGKTHTQKAAKQPPQWKPSEGDRVSILSGEYKDKEAEVRLVSGISVMCLIDGMEDQRKWIPLADIQAIVPIEEQQAEPTSVKEEVQQKAKELGIPKTGLPDTGRNEGMEEQERLPATYTGNEARYAEMAIDLVVMPVEQLRLCFENAINQFSEEQIRTIHAVVATRL